MSVDLEGFLGYGGVMPTNEITKWIQSGMVGPRPQIPDHILQRREEEERVRQERQERKDRLSPIRAKKRAEQLAKARERARAYHEAHKNDPEYIRKKRLRRQSYSQGKYISKGALFLLQQLAQEIFEIRDRAFDDYKPPPGRPLRWEKRGIRPEHEAFLKSHNHMIMWLINAFRSRTWTHADLEGHWWAPTARNCYDDEGNVEMETYSHSRRRTLRIDPNATLPRWMEHEHETGA